MSHATDSPSPLGQRGDLRYQQTVRESPCGGRLHRYSNRLARDVKPASRCVEGGSIRRMLLFKPRTRWASAIGEPASACFIQRPRFGAPPSWARLEECRLSGSMPSVSN